MGSNSISNKEPVDVCHTAGFSLIIICKLAAVLRHLKPDDRRVAIGKRERLCG